MSSVLVREASASSTIKYSTTEHSTMEHSTIKHSTMEHSSMEHSNMGQSTMEHPTLSSVTVDSLGLYSILVVKLLSPQLHGQVSPPFFFLLFVIISASHSHFTHLTTEGFLLVFIVNKTALSFISLRKTPGMRMVGPVVSICLLSLALGDHSSLHSHSGTDSTSIELAILLPHTSE